MEINTTTALIKLSYKSIIVAPFKHLYKDKSFPYRIDDPKDADLWCVLGVGGMFDVALAEFEAEDQDKAHQFAELLTECLTNIKAFTDEEI